MARTDEPLKKPRKTNKKEGTTTTAGRDVPLPKTGKFDPADKNKDGWVSPSEQRKYNKVQQLKKGKTNKKGKGANALKMIAGGLGTLVTASEAYKKIKENVN